MHCLAKLIGVLPYKTQCNVTIFHQQLFTLIELYLRGFQITYTTTEDLAMKLLLSLDKVNLTYDTTKNKVLDVLSA